MIWLEITACQLYHWARTREFRILKLDWRCFLLNTFTVSSFGILFILNQVFSTSASKRCMLRSWVVISSVIETFANSYFWSMQLVVLCDIHFWLVLWQPVLPPLAVSKLCDHELVRFLRDGLLLQKEVLCLFSLVAFIWERVIARLNSPLPEELVKSWVTSWVVLQSAIECVAITSDLWIATTALTNIVALSTWGALACIVGVFGRQSVNWWLIFIGLMFGLFCLFHSLF